MSQLWAGLSAILIVAIAFLIKRDEAKNKKKQKTEEA